MRARIQQLESTKLAEAKVSEYRHKVHMICLKKASTKTTTIEKARPPAWEPPNYSWSRGELHDEASTGDLHVAVVGIGDLLLLGSNVDCSGRSGKTKWGK